MINCVTHCTVPLCPLQRNSLTNYCTCLVVSHYNTVVWISPVTFSINQGSDPRRSSQLIMMMMIIIQQWPWVILPTYFFFSFPKAHNAWLNDYTGFSNNAHRVVMHLWHPWATHNLPNRWTAFPWDESWQSFSTYISTHPFRDFKQTSFYIKKTVSGGIFTNPRVLSGTLEICCASICYI